MLCDFGDIPDVLAAIAPRKALLAAPTGKCDLRLATVQVTEKEFVREPNLLLRWLEK